MQQLKMDRRPEQQQLELEVPFRSIVEESAETEIWGASANIASTPPFTQVPNFNSFDCSTPLTNEDKSALLDSSFLKLNLSSCWEGSDDSETDNANETMGSGDMWLTRLPLVSVFAENNNNKAPPVHLGDRKSTTTTLLYTNIIWSIDISAQQISNAFACPLWNNKHNNNNFIQPLSVYIQQMKSLN